MSFAIRGDIIASLGQQFALNNEQLGWIAGTAFWGFTLAIFLGGRLCDALEMKWLLRLAFAGHFAGIFLTIFAQGFRSLFAGALAIGIANDSVETACNPLVATLYPNDKTKMLNRFHVWFPGGIVVGGLVAYGLSEIGVGGPWKTATMLVPLAVYGAMFFAAEFPRTERMVSVVPTADVLIIAVCMPMTASTELGSNQ